MPTVGPVSGPLLFMDTLLVTLTAVELVWAFSVVRSLVEERW